MNKTKQAKFFVSGIVVLLIVGALLVFILLDGNSSGKIRKCPTHWYQDDMPTISGAPEDSRPEDRQYMIFSDGTNYDMGQIDINWVKRNCEVNSPEVVV